MVNRRRFLTFSSLAGLISFRSFSAFKSVVNPTKINPKVSPPNVKPIVLSTWRQPKANAAAQAVLDQGGRALDAVEAGVRIPKQTPKI